MLRRGISSAGSEVYLLVWGFGWYHAVPNLTCLLLLASCLVRESAVQKCAANTRVIGNGAGTSRSPPLRIKEERTQRKGSLLALSFG